MQVTSLFIFGLMLFTQQCFALYGGRKLGPDQFPAVVTLHLADPDNSKYSFFCNGVLIAPNKVLTAAHCLDWIGREVYDDIHRLTAEPNLMVVKAQGRSIRAKIATFAPNYFEDHGAAGEDLAIIELYGSFNIRPLPIAKKAQLPKTPAVTMVARGQMAESLIKRISNFPRTSLLTIDGARAGLCPGDSGGALLIKNNGQFELAGILIYEGGARCSRGDFKAYFPKARF